MSGPIFIEPLTVEAFAPFGDIIDCSGEPDQMINAGKCARHHDLARLEFAAGGRAGISVFNGQAYALPHALTLMERHPSGSQAFIPMSRAPYLVIVAPDDGGRPARPLALLAAAEQGVNILRNVWHGVLTPMEHSARFAVIDWIGAARNLEEHRYDYPLMVQAR